MSSRCHETAIYALDRQGVPALIAYVYDFAGGYYRCVTQLGNLVYEALGSGDGEDIETKGDPLPRLSEEDLASFFQDSPTENMALAAIEAALDRESVTKFLLLTVCCEQFYPLEATCRFVSADGMEGANYDLCHVEEEVADSLESIAKGIFAMGLHGFCDFLNGHRTDPAVPIQVTFLKERSA